MSQKTDAIVRELRAYGLAYPGTHTKSPWPGHLDLAVKDKTFAYLSLEGEPFGISCKLPRSSAVALMLPFCKPAGYGLGKSGWVDAKFTDDNIPVDMLKEWIDESYRAQAPKKLIDQIGTAAAAATPNKAPRKKKKATGAAARRPAARRAAAPAARRARRTRRS